jgi:hypothetical protein
MVGQASGSQGERSPPLVLAELTVRTVYSRFTGTLVPWTPIAGAMMLSVG